MRDQYLYFLFHTVNAVPLGKNNAANARLMSEIQRLFDERASPGEATSVGKGPTPSPTQFRYQGPKHWSSSDVNSLIRARCQDNPPTFRQIAEELNRFHERVGTKVDREFTAKICSNKWYSLFPNQLDANRTVEYCRMLQKKWPNLQYFTKTETVGDKSRPPKLIALHIIWPWSQEIIVSLAGKQYLLAEHAHNMQPIHTLHTRAKHEQNKQNVCRTCTKLTWHSQTCRTYIKQTPSNMQNIYQTCRTYVKHAAHAQNMQNICQTWCTCTKHAEHAQNMQHMHQKCRTHTKHAAHALKMQNTYKTCRICTKHAEHALNVQNMH